MLQRRIDELEAMAHAAAGEAFALSSPQEVRQHLSRRARQLRVAGLAWLRGLGRGRRLLAARHSTALLVSSQELLQSSNLVTQHGQQQQQRRLGGEARLGCLPARAL
jgi:hypothetical protein